MEDPTLTPDVQEEEGSTNYKVKHPDVYNGERVKLDQWLLQMDLYFKFNEKIDPVDKACVAATYMRDNAQKWIAPQLTKYLDDDVFDDENTNLFENWNIFKAKLHQVFGVSNEGNKAIRQIQGLRQTRAAADYAADFQHYAIQTNWDDNALMTLYRQGLKPRVKEELMRSGAEIKTLESLYEETIRIDNDLFELQMELHGGRGYKSAFGNPNAEALRYFPQGKGRAVPIKLQHQYPREMDWTRDVNTTVKSKPTGYKGKKSNKSQSKDSKGITCYACGKTGHIARNCRSKNKVTRQVNVTVKATDPGEDVEESEWEVVTSDPAEEPGEGRLLTDYPDSEDTQSDDNEDRAIKLMRSMAGTRPKFEKEVWPTAYQLQLAQQNSPEGSVEYDSDEITRQVEDLQLDEEDPWEGHYRSANNCQARESSTYQSASEEKYEDAVEDLIHDPNTAKSTRKRLQDDYAQYDRHWRLTYDGSRRNQRYAQTGTTRTQPWKGVFEWPVHGTLEPPKVFKERLQEYANECRTQGTDVPSFKPIMTNGDERPGATMLDGYHAPDEAEAPLARPSMRQNHYASDLRNGKHAGLSWTACYHDNCYTHLSDKQACYFPRPPKGTCRKVWYQCYKMLCPVHLYDKRLSANFPGATAEQTIHMQIVTNQRCSNDNWQACLNIACKTHYQEKCDNGFGPDISFLDQRSVQGPMEDTFAPRRQTRKD